MKKTRVYIASPYTIGRAACNVRLQLEAQQILMDYNFVPFAPLLNHFGAIYHYRDEKEWFDWDIEWLKVCDILIRIRPEDEEGIEIPSGGADIEEKIAHKYGLLVFNFNNLNELRDWAYEFIKQKEMQTEKEIDFEKMEKLWKLVNPTKEEKERFEKLAMKYNYIK